MLAYRRRRDRERERQIDRRTPDQQVRCEHMRRRTRLACVGFRRAGHFATPDICPSLELSPVHSRRTKLN